MNTTMNLLFYLKKPKVYSAGPVPIYLRVTINSRRAEVSTGRECEPDKWISSSGRMSGTRQEAKVLNHYLDTLQVRLFEIHRQLISAGEQISSEVIKNKFLGKEEKQRTLLKIFEQHNNQMKALIGREFALGTLERYKTSLKHTREFIAWKYAIEDIDICRIDYAFVTAYEFYLRSVRHCNNNSAVKYIKNFGKIIHICIANGWLDKNPFVSERLKQVRDIFLFSCFTGLAYADVKKLDRNQIVIGIDGEKWINTRRQKTDTRSNIPLLPVALELLNKYSNHPQCLNENKLLPVLSNQKMNSYLKEIADCCGINKELTFHIARHTFATTVTLTNGVSIESVSKMLGHKNLRTTQHYAKILDQKVSADMQILKSKYQAENIPKQKKLII
jgi:site-specific recombinase XerD